MKYYLNIFYILIKKVYYKLFFPYKIKKIIYKQFKYDEKKAKLCLDKFKYKPIISIITPIYKPNLFELEEYFNCILKKNIYINIQLCIIVDGDNNPILLEYLKGIKKKFNIELTFSSENLGITKATELGIIKSTGDYVCFIDQDDLINKYTFYEIVKCLQTEKYDYIYSDENMIDENGFYKNYNFKPNFSPHNLLSRMYTNHISIYKREILNKILPLDKKYDGCQDYFILLSCLKYIKKVKHIDKILYNWRQSEKSISKSTSNKNYIYNRAEKLLKKYFLYNYNISTYIKHINNNYIYNINFSKKNFNNSIMIFIMQKTNINMEYYKDIEKKINNIFSFFQNNIKLYVISNSINNKNLFNVNHNIDYIKFSSDNIDKIIRKYIYEYVLFIDIKYLINFDTNILFQLFPLFKINHTGIVSPCLLNSKNKIFKSGCVLDKNKLYFPGRNRKYGTSDYYGINFSLVNHTLSNEECFLFKQKDYSDTYNIIKTKNFTEYFIDLSLSFLKNNKYSVINNNVYLKMPFKYFKYMDYYINLKQNNESYNLLINKWGEYLKKDRFYNNNFNLKGNLLYKI